MNPQSEDVTAMYKHFFSESPLKLSFLFCCLMSQRAVCPWRRPERARAHTRDGLSITSHPAGPFWGLLSCTVKGSGWGWRGEAGEGVERGERDEARAWGAAVQASCPAVWKLSRPHGSSRRCLLCRMTWQTGLPSHLLCVYGKYEVQVCLSVHLCLCVLDCHECLQRAVICAPSGVTYCNPPAA